MRNISDCDHLFPLGALSMFTVVLHYILLVVGLPSNCLAIYGLFQLVKADYVMPVYAINLLIADLIQVTMTPILIGRYTSKQICTWDAVHLVDGAIFNICVCASIGFLVCIALERYLIVAHPLWYRCRRSLRHTRLVSLATWVVSILVVSIKSSLENMKPAAGQVFHVVYLLTLFPVPLVLLVFSYVGSGRALCGPSALTATEKRRIRHTLALVLFIFAGIFGPHFLLYLVIDTFKFMEENIPQGLLDCQEIALNIRCLNPLLDPFLYMFLRYDFRSARDFVPCCWSFVRVRGCCRRASAAQGDTGIETVQSPD
ncbi:ovarian cancer G-protein coupled receptor 1-like [Amia ocellicauda]|uniref:ovarian cancer G-protein coupled receptor 1-like n=1 Tax=Amia ocellicauda TaxID=2972642 RepID=UPI0034649B6E